MLPPLYAAWIEALLGAAPPEEREATCDRCAMRPPAGGPRSPGAVYFTESMCCTYSPRVHAFLAGRLLDDGAEDVARARAELERRIDARSGITPRGVLGPRWYWSLYATATFGRSERLRCPYFEPENGRCGMWRHRESVCATWFCKFERGALGDAFWSAAADLLRHLEEALTLHCALELEVGSEALAMLARPEERESDGDDLDGRVPDERHAAAWGRWIGREREYYRACARITGALSPLDVERLGGAQGRALTAVARQRLEALSAERVEGQPLRLGTYHVVTVQDGFARVRTYRSFDPLDVPLGLLAALPRFDGRPTPEVVEEIAVQHGIAVSPQLLRTLTDFEIIVPVGAPAVTPTRGGERPR